PVGAYALLLSDLYNVIKDPTSGLEWGRFAEDDFESNPSVRQRAVLNQAWSLSLLRLLDKAGEIIDSVREPILKSGVEGNLGWLYFVTGVSEMVEGSLDNAAKNMEDAIELYEGKHPLEYVLIIMENLAQLDALRAQADFEERENPWIALLEEKATSDDLPGILGQALLLKAKLAYVGGDEGALRELAEKIRTLGENPSMAFLNEGLEHLLTRS
ncbi:MAG: hypothetical protein ACFFEU_08335, partial [Candidatus Thorarchaeota archaeon]